MCKYLRIVPQDRKTKPLPPVPALDALHLLNLSAVQGELLSSRQPSFGWKLSLYASACLSHALELLADGKREDARTIGRCGAYLNKAASLAEKGVPLVVECLTVFDLEHKGVTT